MLPIFFILHKFLQYIVLLLAHNISTNYLALLPLHQNLPRSSFPRSFFKRSKLLNIIITRDSSFLPTYNFLSAYSTTKLPSHFVNIFYQISCLSFVVFYSLISSNITYLLLIVTTTTYSITCCYFLRILPFKCSTAYMMLVIGPY